MIVDSYTPTNFKAKDEALQFAQGTVAQSELIAELSPLMLDAVNKKLKPWDGSAGTAKFLTVKAVDASASDVANVPLYKSGSINASAIKWPDGTTDADKLVAFVGSPISVFV